MSLNIDTKIRFSKKEFMLVISQFIIIGLHFIKVNLFNQKLIQGEFLIINVLFSFGLGMGDKDFPRFFAENNMIIIARVIKMLLM